VVDAVGDWWTMVGENRISHRIDHLRQPFSGKGSSTLVVLVVDKTILIYKLSILIVNKRIYARIGFFRPSTTVIDHRD